MTGSGPLTVQLWSSIDATYGAILEHPFIAGLTDGSLDQAAFRFYVIQDAHYLREFARALSVAAARAPEERDIAMFNEHAAGAIAVERQLHESFFSDFGLSETDVAATPMAPTNLAYTSYLLAVAYGGSFPEALGALLPCYWIYWEVGKQLLERGSPDTLYQRWIATYGGEEYAAIVKAVIALTDRVGENLSTSERDSMLGNFQTTARYEWISGTWAIASSSGRSSQHGAASGSVASDRLSWSAPTHLRACQCVPVWPSCFVRALPFKPPATSSCLLLGTSCERLAANARLLLTSGRAELLRFVRPFRAMQGASWSSLLGRRSGARNEANRMPRAQSRLALCLDPLRTAAGA